MTDKPDDLQRLLAEAPFVRALARSLVADEADDVAQQAYLQALGSPAVPSRPRAWLSRIVQHLAVDLRRRRARRQLREREAAVHERLPSSRELLEVEERRRELVAAVDALPVDQRAVVLLRYYEGLPPRRIAVELGVPVATVWSRLHEALTALRAKLDREHGERRAWLVPLAALAEAPRALPWREVVLGGGGTLIGVMAMTAKAKVLAAVAVVMLAAGAWMLWPGGGAPGSPIVSAAGGKSPALAQGDVGGAARTADMTPTQRQAVDVTSPTAPTTGNLVVHVQYTDEPKLAAGLLVSVLRPGGDFRVGLPRAVTDDTGTARFEALAPGRVGLHLNREWRQLGAQAMEIRAGESTECTLILSGKDTVTGVVVDPDGVGVGGARVEAVPAATGNCDPEVVAVTAADGSFAVRSAFSPGLYGARAPGFAASRMYGDWGDTGAHRDEPLRIVLTAPGGCVEGTVVDTRGAPVEGAVVRIGEGRTDGLLAMREGSKPVPAQVLTDAAGGFLAVGVPAGAQPVQVRAPGQAPWQGSCEVAASGTVALRVVLVAGVTCLGVVRQGDGAPAAEVSVRVGRRGDFLQYFATSAADGSFALHGLPAFEFELWAQSLELGKASATLRGEAGATLHAELQLSLGLALRGVAVDEDDRPLQWVQIRCRAEGGGEIWSKGAFSDDSGRFVVPDCPVGRTLAIEASAKDRLSLRLGGIVPGVRDLTLKLLADREAKARVTGRVLLPDGSLAKGAGIRASRRQPEDTVFGEQKDGPFALQLQAGSWEVRLECDGHPMVFAGTRDLQAGELWDLGAITLTNGGTLVVREEGAGKPGYLIVTASAEFRAGLYSPTPPLRSGLLAPGDYLLLTRGEGIVAEALPFTIRSGEETAMTVKTRAGVRQQLAFVLPPGGEAVPSVPFQLRRGGKLVSLDFARTLEGGAVTAEVWLEPGSYEVTTREGGPQGRAAFTVGESEGERLRVLLR